MEDKIDVRFGAWSICLPPEDFFHFKHHLACPPKNLREEAFKEKGLKKPLFGAIFCRPEIKGRNRNRLQIRSTQALEHPHEARRFEPLLFSGHAYFGGREKFGPSKNRMAIHANLGLNLQRFIRHQPASDDLENFNPKNSKTRLRKRRGERATFDDETALDGKDNWIPNTTKWRNFANGNKTIMHLRGYIEAVRRRIESEFRRADYVAAKAHGGTRGFRIEREYYALSAVENAWEFSSDDAIGDVESWGERIAQFFERRSREDFNSSNKKEIEWDRNSPCYSIGLAKNVSLRLYAKTSQRIRFEMVHKKVNWTEAVKEAQSSTDGSLKLSNARRDHSQDVRSLDDLICVLQQVRKKSAMWLNKIMEDLRARHKGQLYRPFVDLVAEVAGALPKNCTMENNARLLRAMIHILCGQLGFRGSASKGEFAPVIKALKQRGVIQWCGRRRFYRLCAEFTRAAEAFQKMDDHFYSLVGSATAYRKFHVVNGHEIRDRVRTAE